MLLPARDCAATIGAAVESVLRQSFSDFELLIVDDGSTDGTAQAAVRAARGDPRLAVLPRERLGLVPALQAGLSVCRGALVVRMDGDDRMRPERIAAQVHHLREHPGHAAVATHVALDPPDSPLQGYVEWLNGMGGPADVAREIFVESPVCHPSVTFRRDAIRRLGGYRDPGWPEDWDLWLRLVRAGGRIGVLGRELHVWSDSPERYTRTNPRCSRDALMRARAHYLALALPGACRVWGAGRDGKRLARALVAEGIRIDAFIDIDPKKIGGVRRGDVPVLGPDALLGPPDGSPILAAVGVPGARRAIRATLSGLGYREGTDFYAAA